MTPRTRRLALCSLVLCVAAGTACTPEDEFFLEAFQNVVFSEQPDPMVQAAGEAAEAVEREKTAAQLVDEGYANDDLDLVDQAIDRHPFNAFAHLARYALLTSRGDTVGALTSLGQAAFVAATYDHPLTGDQFECARAGVLHHAIDIEHDNGRAVGPRAQRLQSELDQVNCR